MWPRIWISFYFLQSVLCELTTEAIVEMRWDFSDCEQTGRFGPTQEQCDAAYKGSSLEGDVTIDNGVQVWTAPASGLYLITARAPSGLELVSGNYGQGAVVTADFRIEKGEKFRILVGQQSDYDPALGRSRGPGGSGGTFVSRSGDNFLMLVAGGGSSGAGNPPKSSMKFADAAFTTKGKSGSRTLTSSAQGPGGSNGSGGARGIATSEGASSSGGGAGWNGDGEASYISLTEMQKVEFPLPSISYSNKGFGNTAPGVGGYLMFSSPGGGVLENNGGFGGGGSGSADGGAGGGGGYSGGGGGPPNGWGGGGGSMNAGETARASTLQKGRGSVTISFTGHPCCGPIVVYIAMCFVGGIVLTLLVAFLIYRCIKLCKEYEVSPPKEKSGGKFFSVGKKKGFYSVFGKSSDTHDFSARKQSKQKKKVKSYGQYTKDNDGPGPREAYDEYDDSSRRKRRPSR